MLSNVKRQCVFVPWVIGILAAGIIFSSLFAQALAAYPATPGVPEPDPNPPVNKDADPCQTAAGLGSQADTSDSGVPNSVPVNDSVTHELLRAIAGENNTLQMNSVRIGEYLRLLCEKEYNEDRELQHAWANLIGDFVKETVKFITRGYEGNPAFIDNQDAYYQLVNIATARVFMQDVADSKNIGVETRKNIIRSVALNLYSDFFPYKGQKVLADDAVPNYLAQNGFNYDTDQYWQQYNDLVTSQNSNSISLITQADAELAARQQKQLDQEQQKLDWGRGFFSYEVCDFQIYTRANGSINPEDRRNCRIVTPGSLIQDQTSFVFGTALRQMEVADEYEEWIAPDTLAALSDILSYRGLNSSAARNENLIGPGAQKSPSAVASPPDVVRNQVDISGTYTGNNANQNPDGPLPFEFTAAIPDLVLTQGYGNPGELVFGDVLDAQSFLDQVK